MRIGVSCCVLAALTWSASGVAGTMVEVPQEVIYDPLSQMPIDIGITGSMTQAEIAQWAAKRQAAIEAQKDKEALKKAAPVQVVKPADLVEVSPLRDAPAPTAAPQANLPHEASGNVSGNHRGSHHERRRKDVVHESEAAPKAATAKPKATAGSSSAFDAWLSTIAKPTVPGKTP